MNGIFSQYDSQDLNRIAAKGIQEKLRNIRQRINVEFIAKRLIWELIQNAKDNAATCNINGNPNVSIEIELNANNLKFSHNNGYFTNENVRGLIRRYSSSDKDRENETIVSPPATTGRFGTGFMTTHLLSEKVLVKGVFNENKNSFCKFELPLDRSGVNEKEIIRSIENAFFEIEESMKAQTRFEISTINKHNTEFLYYLNEEGYKLAEISIAELNDSLPYTLINIPNIERIDINQNGESYFYKIKKIKDFETGNSKISIIEFTSNNHNTLHNNFATIIDDNTRIIIPIIYNENSIEIQNINKNVPKLFLDFPLIGTEDLNIPFVINNPLFEPTEQRDGVSLTGGNDKDTLINSNILIKAFELYKEFVDFACEQPNWGTLFNLARIKKPKEKDWIDAEWFKTNITHPIQAKLLISPIVESNAGVRVCIKDSDGEDQIFFPSATKEEIRNRIWEFSNDYYPKQLPIKEHIHQWYEIIKTFKDITQQYISSIGIDIHYFKDIKNLSLNLNKTEEKTIEWLNDYYDLLNLEGEFIDFIIKDKFAIIPNQNGIFKKRSDLFVDAEIDEELKNVMQILGIDLRDKLRHKDVITKSNYTDNSDIQIKYNVKNQESVVDDINKIIVAGINENIQKACDYLCSCFSDDEDFPVEQDFIYKFCKDLWDMPEKKKLHKWSKEIWQEVNKRQISRIHIIVSQTKRIYKLEDILKLDYFKTKDWFYSFANFLIKYNYDNLLNLSAYPILPNQYAVYCIKDKLFFENGEIDEDLKNIASELGSEIFYKLIDKAIFLELPENRGIDEVQVADEISKLVKPLLHNITEREDNKEVIRMLYLWMNKNRLKAEKLFSEVYEKRFLLISDDEITANIEKAEIIDEILGETGMSSSEIKDKLIALLNNTKSNISEDMSKFDKLEDDIIISPDLVDNSDERSRISTNEEAKIIIFDTLRNKGFIVPNNISINYTIVSGVSKPNGIPIKIVIKSGKAGKIYFNPSEWMALTETDSQLFVVTSGNIVRNVTLNDLAALNDSFHMRFNTKAFAIETNLKAFADFFRYLPYTHFIFDTPESTSDYLEEFGLNKRNPSASTLSSDDKNLLH